MAVKNYPALSDKKPPLGDNTTNKSHYYLEIVKTGLFRK